MGNWKKKGDDLLYYYPAVILIFTFTLIYGWIPPLKNLVLLFLGLLLGVVVCVKYYQKPMMFAFLAYFLVVYLNKMAGDVWISDNKTLFGELFKLVLTGLMGYAMITAKDKRFLNITIVSFLLMLVANAIGTSFVETIVPGSIRTLEVMRHHGELEDAMTTYYYRFGMANYALPSGLVTVIPMIVLGIKMNSKNKKKRFLLILSLLSCLMLVYYSGSTTALILGVLGFLVALFVKEGIGKRPLGILALFGIVLTFILSNENLMLSFLDSIDKWVGYDGYFHDKVDDFETLIISGEASGDIETREQLYQRSWEAVINHPLLGTNERIGGHSLLLDHWGYLGLVGFIPFLIFVIAQIKMFSKMIPVSTRIIYTVCIFITFMMMFIKNMNGWETWLCLFTILPLLANYCVGESAT